MNHVIVHLGVVWVLKMNNGWFSHIKAFPEAIDKKGEPQIEHPVILKYVKEHFTSS